MAIGSMDTPGTEYPWRTIYTDHDVYYVPFIAEDGRVGYRVGRTDEGDTETFVYLNPSDSVDQPGSGDVFLYVGIENDPAEDLPVVFVPMDDAAFGID